MSTALPPRPRVFTPKVRVCIVASKYNEQFTDALVQNAVEEIDAILPNARVDVIRVPGAYEIPVTVEAVLRNDAPTCVIALGLIIRGATAHADLIAQSITTSLHSISIQHAVPVIHEVLLVEDEKQAYARTIGEALNRGREAARTACTMMEVFQEIQRSAPRSTSRNA